MCIVEHKILQPQSFLCILVELIFTIMWSLKKVPQLSLPIPGKTALLEWTLFDVIDHTITRHQDYQKLMPFSSQKTFLSIFCGASQAKHHTVCRSVLLCICWHHISSGEHWFGEKISIPRNACGASKSKVWQTDDSQGDPYVALCFAGTPKRVFIQI